LKTLFAAYAAKTLESRARFWILLLEGWENGPGIVRDFDERGFLGSFAPCGARPEALPLDSATFEKVDETFYLRFA